jgi:hypothetical protein
MKIAVCLPTVQSHRRGHPSDGPQGAAARSGAHTARARRLDRAVCLLQRLLDPSVAPVEDRLGQSGVLDIEVALECLGQVRGSCGASCAGPSPPAPERRYLPSMIAASIARAVTVVSDEATVDSLIEASSSISSSWPVPRVRSPVSRSR